MEQMPDYLESRRETAAAPSIVFMAIKLNKNEIPATIIEAKRWWRREIRRALREMPEEYRSSASDKICSRLLDMEEYRQAKTIFAYISVGREVDTHALIRDMLAGGKRVCLPKCTDLDAEGRRIEGMPPSMEARLVKDISMLIPGAYGIPEPDVGSDFPLIEPEEIDLLLMPCMACDSGCGRIGHGAGYYDRYLDLIRPDCGCLALCYEELIAERLPMEEHDRRVDAVITEEHVYRWRG